MKTVLLYTVTAQEVEMGNHFSITRTPGFCEPLHSLGDGNALGGVGQMPLNAVRPCIAAGGGEAYIALSPELRELLEAPIRAVAAREIECQRVELLALLAAGPWYARVWRALMLGWREDVQGSVPAPHVLA